MRRVAAVFAVAVMALSVGAEAQKRPPARPPAKKTTAVAVCAAELGAGVKTGRRFCDVVVASTGADSVSMTIPPHAGAATLLFDLHNRFNVPAASVPAALAFTSHVALISVIRPTGDVIERVAVSREYRTPVDVFDRLASGARGSAPKAIAPGPPQSVRVTIPSGVGAIGIVGTRLEEWRATGRGAFDSPGRPIAIVSNLRIEYTPR